MPAYDLRTMFRQQGGRMPTRGPLDFEPSGWGTMAGNYGGNTQPPYPSQQPGLLRPNIAQQRTTGMQQLGELRGLVNAMRMGTTPRAAGTPTAAGAYANSLSGARGEVQASGQIGRPGMGLLTNEGAADVYSRGGYMPTMTVGGNYGQPTPGMSGVVTPTMERNQLRLAAVNARLGRRPQAGPLVQRTPEELDARGDAAGAMLAQRRFALPGTIVNQGSQNQAIGETARRLDYDPATNRLQPTPQFRADMVRRGLLDQPGPDAEEMAFRRQITGDMRDQEQARRHGLVVANAQRESGQRDARMAARRQAPNPLYAIAQRNPAVALGIMRLQQEGRTAEASQLLAQEQLKIEGRKADAGMRLAEGNLAIGNRNAATGELEAKNRGLQLGNEQVRLAQRDALEARKFSEESAQQHEANAIAQEQSGDFRGAQESRARAAQSRAQGGGQIQGPLGPMQATPQAQGPLAAMGAAQGGKIPPVSSSTIRAITEQFKNNPQTLVEELRGVGVSDEEINKELARIYGRGRFLGLTTGNYDRTAANPSGWGFSNVDPETGIDHRTLLGKAASLFGY